MLFNSDFTSELHISYNFIYLFPIINYNPSDIYNCEDVEVADNTRGE